MPIPTPPTTTPPLAPGAHFAGHEVVALLHRGAHLDVYEATRGADRRALKLARTDASWQEATTVRFRNEAESAALLRHPHLVRIHEVGVEGAVPFVSADLLAGETLAARLAARGAIPLTEAVDLLLPVMSALVMVRTRNVAHGAADVGNVFLTAGERGPHPWLVDVGVLKTGPADDKRADARAVAALFHAMLAGAPRAGAWTPPALRDALVALRVPPEAAATFARAFDDAAATSPSVRQLGRALLPVASAAARSAWSGDFTGSLLARGRRALVPRSAAQAFGLLLAFFVAIAGIWLIRAQVRPGMHMPFTERRP